MITDTPKPGANSSRSYGASGINTQNIEKNGV
jgi:hypothetical protein